MNSYIVQCRVNGGRLTEVGNFRAKSPAGAIAQAADCLRDIEANLDIIATLVEPFHKPALVEA